MGRSKTRGVCAAICVGAFQGLSGCSLPGSGPSTSDVVQQATVEQTPRYEVVDIDPTTIETLRRWSPESFSTRFGDRKLTAEPVIGVGDAVTVTIWEAGPGGLFSAPLVTDKVSTGSNSATIPEQVVGRDGGITVPYAGRVRVVGKTTRAVQQTIEQALEGKALQPQVLVNVTKATSDSVSVGGEVTMGARTSLVGAGRPDFRRDRRRRRRESAGQPNVRRTLARLDNLSNSSDPDYRPSQRKHLRASGRRLDPGARPADFPRLRRDRRERGNSL